MAKSKRRRNYGKLISKSILVFVIFYFVSTFYAQHKKMEDLNIREQLLIKDVNELQGDIDSLKERLENSSTDEYIEKIAREHLKMIKKGEFIFIDLGKGVN